MSKRITIWLVVAVIAITGFITFKNLNRSDTPSAGVKFKAKSGDLIQFLRDQLVKYGGSLTLTTSVPSLRAEWRYAEDDRGFQILLAPTHKEEFIRCLTAAFGEPLRREKYPRLVYGEDKFGVSIVASLESDPIHIFCLRKGAFY